MSPATETPAAPRARRAAPPWLVAAIKLTLAIFAAIAVFAVLLPQASSPTGVTADDSWGEVLNWAILHHAQWGTQLIFTYGPLGFLRPDAQFNPELYRIWFVLQLCMAAGYALLLGAALKRIHLPAAIGMAAAAFVFSAGWLTSACWILTYPLALVLVDVWSRRRTRVAGLLVLASVAFVTIPSLLKFSVFPLWILWIPAATLLVWMHGRRRLATALFLVAVIFEIALWLLCAQHLAHLPKFWITSWQAAAGYGSAMQGPGTIDADDGLALTGLLFMLAGVAVLGWATRRSIPRLIMAAFLGLTVLLAYKASITRADLGHLMIFWCACVFIAPLLASLLFECSAPRASRAPATLVLALTPLALLWLGGTYAAAKGDVQYRLYSGIATWQSMQQGYRALTRSSGTYASDLRKWNERRSDLSLPATRRLVGDASVDLMTDDQSLLLANDLNYRPRPVFQSYSAYTDALIRLNEQFFLDPARAPQWVILSPGTIDERYPNSDDARALPRVLQLYEPVLRENNHLLMRRGTAQAAPALDAHLQKALRIGWDEDSAIPHANGPLLAKLKVKLTWAAKLRTLLFREPNLYVEAKTTDGKWQRFQLVRPIAASGFMLTPLLRNNEDYLNWLHDGDSNAVTAIRLHQSYWMGLPMFRTKAVLRLYDTALDRSRSGTDIPIALPGSDRVPDHISEQPKIWGIDDRGTPAAFLPAPAVLTFSLPPGSYAVTARYGITPNALTNAACLAAHADGIGIGVGLEGEPIAAADIDYLDPYRDPAHRYAADFKRSLVVPPGKSRMVIALNHGPPGSNGACDWSWIRDISIKPAEGNLR